jgi:hypothetical protein
MSTGERSAPSAFRVSRYFLVLAVVWMVAMTWRIYPQFKDAVRVDGRLMTAGDYIEETCGQRIGPAAATCLAEAREQAQQLLRREQGKSVLLIEAPLFGYLVIYLPLRLLVEGLGRRREQGMARPRDGAIARPRDAT